MRSTRLSFFKSPGIPVPGIVKVNRSHTGFSISSEHANWNGEEGHSNSALTDPSVPEVANSRTKQVNGLVGSNPSSPERDPSAEQHDSQREYISKGTRFTEGNYDQAESVSDDNKYCSSAKAQEGHHEERVVDRSRSTAHTAKMEKLLSEKMVDVEALRSVAWGGIPPHLRPLTWRLLLGYLPPNRDRRGSILKRKRREYLSMVPEFDGEGRERTPEELAMLHQVQIDAPRTAPGESFFHQEAVQECIVRILYIWGIRHPASGYVQGINDIVTPFLAVFLSEHFSGPLDDWDASQLDRGTLMDMEADCYWCLCKFLDSIQDHYTYAQPGIQKKVFRIRELVRRIDAPLADHLQAEGVEFMLFGHRWVNCLLVRGKHPGLSRSVLLLAYPDWLLRSSDWCLVLRLERPWDRLRAQGAVDRQTGEEWGWKRKGRRYFGQDWCP
uniref:Tbc protein n=2 Tax=Tetraselmis sp. GSL018 TaxID=582737 RepID=A0A061R7G5_9CHLO